MLKEPIGELPGDVLIALRKSKGFIRSSRPFADTLPMGYDTLLRLERVRWGTVEEDWDRPVERTDLDALVAAAWIERGDEWWRRFETAFAWQYAVLQNGRNVYEENQTTESTYEPVHLEHAITIVRVLVMREVHAQATSDKPLSSERQAAIADKLAGEVLARLVLRGMLLMREDKKRTAPPEERTRDIQALFARSSQSTVEDPYVRTLRLIYEWAGEALKRELGEA